MKSLMWCDAQKPYHLQREVIGDRSDKQDNLNEKKTIHNGQDREYISTKA